MGSMACGRSKLSLASSKQSRAVAAESRGRSCSENEATGWDVQGCTLLPTAWEREVPHKPSSTGHEL